MMTENYSLHDCAISYAKRGFAVFPLMPKDKIPATKNGFKSATTAVAMIEHWWKKNPEYNIGIATGAMSGGLVAIDLDVDPDQDKNGYHELKQYEKDNDVTLPETVQTITGRGGYHLLYMSSQSIPCSTNPDKGIDIRGDGGYIVAPPSIHPNGRRYEFEVAPDECPVQAVTEPVMTFINWIQHRDNQQAEVFTENRTEPDSKEAEAIKEALPYVPVSRLDYSEWIHSGMAMYSAGLPFEVFDEWSKNDSRYKGSAETLKKWNSFSGTHSRWNAGTIINLKNRFMVEDKVYRKLKTAEELINKDVPEPKVFIGIGSDVPLLVEGTCILSAKPKLGKSWISLYSCLKLASGEDFLGYKTRKCSALYLDLETSEAIQKKRLLRALNGKPVPKNFYLETLADKINQGFEEQLEAYLKEDPDIGVVVVDVFKEIRTPPKNFKESEYDHAYRDITPLNRLAHEHNISIVLVTHDRKTVDPDDPFANILGSTGLQGAIDQMIVMYRKHKDDPIHISVKGRTIDGQPELNVKLDKSGWNVVAGNSEDYETEQSMNEYMESDIRSTILKLVDVQDGWRGRCSELIQESVDLDTPILDSAKTVGLFLHKHQAKFLKIDNIRIKIIKNGNAPKIYKVNKAVTTTIDTIDDDDDFEGIEF